MKQRSAFPSFASFAVVFAMGLSWIAPVVADSTTNIVPRDGHKDFDFLLGSWRTHYERLRHPLSGSHEWYGCDGTSVVRPFWNGSANLEDGDLRCPKQYIHGMTLRLYDARTRQWSLYWGTTKVGLVLPAQVGHFGNGVGDFLANDTYQGKRVVVRFRWTLRPGDHPHFEQAFSTDRGRTWETNWTTDYTRASNASPGSET